MTTPTCIPRSCCDVTDLAEYLGKKYGGWYPAVEAYLRPDGKKWIGLALGAAGGNMVYRESHAQGGGLRRFPQGYGRLPEP
jgi:multiple sugar transport system substrate-binding protein